MASQPFSNDNVDYYVFVGQNYNDFDSDDHDDGDGDSKDIVDKKSIKEIETTVYGDSLYIDFPRSWRPLIVEPISKNSMMVAQLKTQKRTKRKTWQKRGIKIQMCPLCFSQVNVTLEIWNVPLSILDISIVTKMI